MHLAWSDVAAGVSSMWTYGCWVRSIEHTGALKNIFTFSPFTPAFTYHCGCGLFSTCSYADRSRRSGRAQVYLEIRSSWRSTPPQPAPQQPDPPEAAQPFSPDAPQCVATFQSTTCNRCLLQNAPWSWLPHALSTRSSEDLTKPGTDCDCHHQNRPASRALLEHGI